MAANPERAFIRAMETGVGPDVPWWRREPFRVFFPAGVLLSWAGVAPWLLVGVGALDSYPSIYHAMTQVQGFLTCFAVGFLFTMIPRRTGTAPPATWQVAVGLLAPAVCTVAAWYGRWAIAQTAWMVLAVVVVVFLIRRQRSATARRRPPNGFVWIPMAFLMGLAGSVLAGVGGFLGAGGWALHQIGRGLVLQGLFIGLVLGVGALAIPLMTRGEPPPDGAATPADRLERVLHVVAAAFLVLSFVAEYHHSVRLGLALRAVVIGAVLLLGAELWRRPSRPGVTRWLIWIGAWCVPLGYLFGAVFEMRYKAGLHITFIGGFGLMALSVGVQVIMGHAGHERLRDRGPWPLWLMGALVLSAVVPRALVEFDAPSFHRWAALAAASFLTATAVWLAYLVPKMLRGAPTASH